MKTPAEAEPMCAIEGARVLIVEDDFFIAMELESILLDAGADIAGVCRNVKDALAVADGNEVAVAILDVRLGEETVQPVARHLAGRDIPFVFYTGQADVTELRAEWPDCRVIGKPARPQAVICALAEQLRH